MLCRFLTRTLLVCGALGALAVHVDAQTCQWSAAMPPLEELDGVVHAIEVFDDGSGPALYLGGSFVHAGDDLTVNRIVKWDGEQWYHVGLAQYPGITSGASVFALEVFDDDGPEGPNPPALFVGGNFTKVGGFTTAYHVAKFNGVGWTALDGGVYGSGGAVQVQALQVWDEDGEEGPLAPALYVAGNFDRTGTVPDAENVAKWDGQDWYQLGGSVSDFVNALTVCDLDGPGEELPALYAGGGFISADGWPVNRVAKWDGVEWSPLKISPTQYGVDGTVNALESWDEDGDGPGLPSLFIGGAFTSAANGSVPATRIVRWQLPGPDEDPEFTVVGGGVTDAPVYDLHLFDPDGDDTLPVELIMGGVFTVAGGQAANRIASWDGNSWSPLGNGVNDAVRAIGSHDWDDAGSDPPALYAAGSITEVGPGIPVGSLGQWICSPITIGDTNCDGAVTFDDIAPFVTALAGQDSYENAYPDCYWLSADVDGDGTVSFDDIAPFVALLSK